MNTMKSIMFAPVVLTNSLLGGRKQNSESLLENAEDVDVDTDLQTKEKALKKDTATYGIDDNSMNSLVSLELAIHLMHTNKESLGRVLVVTANSNLSKL
jgi:recyclin-1